MRSAGHSRVPLSANSPDLKRRIAAYAMEHWALLRCPIVGAGCNQRSIHVYSGCNTTPPRSNLYHVTAHRTPLTAPEAQKAFRLGIEEFNSGRFFEAHEAWEDIWLRSPEPEKTFLQGVIQIAAAFHHHSRKNLRGTRTLLEAGLGRLEAFPNTYRGIDLAALRAEARKWTAALAFGRITASDIRPQIRFAADR
jgi:hypothetical protein